MRRLVELCGYILIIFVIWQVNHLAAEACIGALLIFIANRPSPGAPKETPEEDDDDGSS